LYGLLAPENLLDLTKNFVVFESRAGRSTRKICRYKQFVAVNKALERIRTAKTAKDRGGVIWHTQGSGKSLTMLWLALKLRRDPRLNNPTIVVVTDRTDLDQQIAGTFLKCGFPNPEQAKKVAHLRELLSGPPGKTVMTTVQKFQEVTGADGDGKKRVVKVAHPTLSTADNIFVLVDEAHRTQYKSLAANMRKALPNACFLGFTGTPIDKQDRSTLTTFGPYIDTYTIEQAVEDEATVPIFYESRLPELRIIGHTLDQVFERVFSDRSEEERLAIQKKYATEDAIAGAPKRIEAICLDLMDHFKHFIQPNGFKAQIVACSRDAAVTYKETLERLNAPDSALVISTGHNDAERFEKHGLSKEQRDRVINDFTDAKNPLCILIVCDMLLTGFDAPIEQVMYLDSPLKEHTLLQAIARVNRKAEGKTYGMVVDYWGVSDALQEALAVFSPSDVKGAMQPKVDELPRLQTRHASAMRFFQTLKEKNDLDACVALLEPEDVRAEFDTAFKAFGESLDMLLPDPRALDYVDDLRWLGKIRGAAKARYRDQSLDISDCGAKVRKLIEDVVVAEGIALLVKEVSLFSKDFDE
jgi:type I restriction enzyme, R subunit